MTDNQSLEKIIQDRIQMVLDDPMMLKALQRFGGGIFRRSSVFHGLARFLSLHNVRGDTCFEIGTWNGLTAAILSRHFRRVVSVDIAHNKIKHEVMRELGITNVEFHDIADNGAKAVVAKRLHFDFAYLDGDHAHDTLDDFRLTEKCGRVLFHEVWEHQKPVWDLVQKLDQGEVVYGGICFALWQKA